MFADILITGLPAGCLYALVAASFNILYRPTNVFNFAQGDLVLLGAMFFVTLKTIGWMPWQLALLIGIVGVGLLAVVIERVAVAPLLRRSTHGHGWIITTLAVSMIAANVAGKVWGSDPVPVSAPFGLGTEPIDMGGLLIPSYQVALLVFTLVLIVGIEALYQTRMGRAVIGVAENRDTALLRGINPATLSVCSFFLGGALAGLTGYLAAPILFASTSLGAGLLLKGFAAAALGGLGSNRGALVAGVVIGLTESTSSSFLPAGYQNAVILAVVLTVLLARPQGIFGNVHARAV
ncbi:branched-chain amino acid ABC transporter permease [soil metagenome]